MASTTQMRASVASVFGDGAADAKRHSVNTYAQGMLVNTSGTYASF